MTSKQRDDNGEICQNCANIFTEALECFLLFPLEECRRDGKFGGLWFTKETHRYILSEHLSSQFGTSPLDCYVCFRSSQLVQTAGSKQVTLMLDDGWSIIHMHIEDEAESRSVKFTLNLGDEISANQRRTARVIRQRPGCILSKESLDHINNNWMKPCRDDHEHCQRQLPRNYDALPSRIIHVRMEYSGEQPRLVARLVDVQRLPVNIKYITLSHAWGQQKFVTLTSENLNQFRQSIPLSAPDFNQTFKDAMGLTVKLGYNYIWIDSLCIIQGSPASDWVYECPRMGSICCNSDLNLSASGFRDARFGMFGPSRRLVVPPTIWDNVRVIHESDYSPEEMPLNRRGWVIQENILSPRTLHFMSSGEMLWECNSSLVSEVWPDKILEFLLHNKDYKDWKSRKGIYADLPTACLANDSLQREQEAASLESDLLWPQAASPQKMKLLTNWYFVVMPQVQIAELTCILDKLPCIQGIAELFKDAIGCDYLAGHWELCLIESLDWVPPGPYDMASYTDMTPVAPSWSLASVHGKTWYRESDCGVLPLAEYLGVSSSTISNDPTKTSGLCRLRIKGHAHRLGMDVNEVISGTKSRPDILDISPGSSWLPGLWPSRDPINISRGSSWLPRLWPSRDSAKPPDRNPIPAKVYVDPNQSYKMEASLQRHENAHLPNGHQHLITIRKDSNLFLLILTIHRGSFSKLSGIVARQVSEEFDGPVLERIGQWYDFIPSSKRRRFVSDSFRDFMKQTIYYLV